MERKQEPKENSGANRHKEFRCQIYGGLYIAVEYCLDVSIGCKAPQQIDADCRNLVLCKVAGVNYYGD